MTNTHRHTLGRLLWTGVVPSQRPLTKHNTRKWQTSKSPEEIEPTIPKIKRPQIHALERAAPGLSFFSFMCNLSPILSRLSHGSPLFAMPMKIKLNTPRNIRVNNSQHCRMPCRINLFAWRDHPHTYRFVNWIVFIPSGLLVGFYPGVEKSSE